MTREPLTSAFSWTQPPAIALLLLLSTVTLSGQVGAQSASLEGSWQGGGSVSFASGENERAQCRVQYRRASGTSYTLTATCATPSGRATQTATVRQVGGNTYQGTFHNSEYNVSGTISVTAGGNRQTVRLTSDAGSASLELRR